MRVAVHLGDQEDLGRADQREIGGEAGGRLGRVVHAQATAAKVRGGRSAYGRQTCAAERAHVAAQAGELLQQRLDAAGRGERQPVGGGQPVEEVGSRRQGLGTQHRHLGCLRSGRFEQADDLARAAAHARHQDAPPRERLRIVPGELLAQPHHLPHHDERGRVQAGCAHAGVDVRESAGHDALAGGRPSLDHRGRRRGGASLGQQSLGDPRQVGQPHEEDQRVGSRGDAGPVDPRPRPGRVLVARDDGEARGVAAVRDRDARISGRGDR